MTTGIDKHYIQLYKGELTLAYQQKGGKVYNRTTITPAMGTQAQISDYIEPTSANENPGRLSSTPSNNADSTRPWLAPIYFDHGIQIAKQDATRVMSSATLRQRYAENQAEAMARKRDDIILASAIADMRTGDTGSVALAIPAANSIALNYGASANTGLTVQKLLRLLELAEDAGIDVINDPITGFITPRDKYFLMSQIRATSKEYRDTAVLEGNELKQFLGINFETVAFNVLDKNGIPQYSRCFNALVNGTQRRLPFYPKSALEYGEWKGIQMEEGIRPDLSNALQLYSFAEGGASAVQNTGRFIINTEVVA